MVILSSGPELKISKDRTVSELVKTGLIGERDHGFAGDIVIV